MAQTNRSLSCPQTSSKPSIRQKKHIFTHITWEMEGFELVCGQESDRFVWATPAQLEEEYPLPTAFRQFLEETK